MIKANFNKTKKLAFEFCDYAILTQEQLKEHVHNELKHLGYKSKIKDGYVFARGELPILLVAHLDTVHREVPCNVWFSANYNKIKADEGIGGDDRCGVFIIMNILKETKLRPNILFVEDEEIGSIGSAKFIKHYNQRNLDLDYIIEIDRKGSIDSVYYDLDNPEFEEYIDGFGFKKDWGSFTDICTLCPHFEVAGVNLSSGYYLPHTKDEYVVVSDMMNTRNKIVKILNTHLKSKERHKFDWIEKTYTYTSYRGCYSYGTDWYSKKWVDRYNKENSVKKTNPYYVGPCFGEYGTQYESICSYCGAHALGRDDECECFCCDECAKTFGMHVCESCGCYSWDKECERCVAISKIQESHSHDGI